MNIKSITKALAELANYAGIVLVGLFLIGFYWSYETINTGYQDWAYHAFRIQSLLENGISSWDHVWANGINHWRGYQFWPHIITAIVYKTTGLSITKSMIAVIMTVFIASRLMMYGTLRALKVDRLVALLITIVSFTLAQQWLTMLDFSIYTSVVLIPVIIWLFAKSHEESAYKFISSASMGAMFLIHPLSGIVCFPFFITTLLDKKIKTTLLSKIARVFLYLSVASPFWIQQIIKPYTFQNEVFSTASFARSTLPFPYLGLDTSYIVIILISWVLLLSNQAKIKTWAKWTLLLSTLGVLIVWAAYNGRLPSWIYQLQISRSIIFFGYTIPIAAGYIIHKSLPSKKSIFLKSACFVLLGIHIIKAAAIGSQYAATPINTPSTPIKHWFATTDTSPLIYYSNDSEAAFEGDSKIRLVGSYNEHALPSPISYRFKNLLTAAVRFDVKDTKQLSLIDDYARVLGVDYFVLPTHSPFTQTLTSIKGYVVEDQAKTDVGAFTLVRRNLPNYDAFIYNPQTQKDIVNTNAHISQNSSNDFSEWDQEISNLTDAIATEKLKPVEIKFSSPAKITATIEGSIENQAVLITQNYDRNWRVNDNQRAKISPTNLRFMSLTNISVNQAGEIILTNNWPVWFWPMQLYSLFLLISTYLTVFFYGSIKQIIETVNNRAKSTGKEKGSNHSENLDSGELISI